MSSFPVERFVSTVYSSFPHFPLFNRLSASIDETSFWQFLFVLSSALKAGECSPAQLVVKLHYVLNMAQYCPVGAGEANVDVVQSAQMKVDSGVTVVTHGSGVSGDDVSAGAETVVRAPIGFTASAAALAESSGVFGGAMGTASNNDMSSVSAVVSDLTVEGADRVESGSGTSADDSAMMEMVVEPKVEKVEPVEKAELVVESTETEMQVVSVPVPVVKAPIQPFSSKLEAIRGFNLFLPVMVGRA